MADICNQGRLILNSVYTDIKLWPCRDGLECKISIEDICLNVCKVAVSPLVMMGHTAGLQITDGKYPFQRTDIRTFNIAQNSYGDTLQDIWQGKVPSRLIVGMVKSSAYSGDF